MTEMGIFLMGAGRNMIEEEKEDELVEFGFEGFGRQQHV